MRYPAKTRRTKTLRESSSITGRYMMPSIGLRINIEPREASGNFPKQRQLAPMSAAIMPSAIRSAYSNRPNSTQKEECKSGTNLRADASGRKRKGMPKASELGNRNANWSNRFG